MTDLDELVDLIDVKVLVEEQSKNSKNIIAMAYFICKATELTQGMKMLNACATGAFSR